MKIIKILGGIIAALVFILLILGLIAPSHTHVDRSVTINAPYDHVWSYVNNFKGMDDWSPWTELDPNQVTTFENDGAVGAIYTWSGNDSVGKGEQTITSMTDNEVVTHLHFIEPFDAEADATTTVLETEEGIQVTWSYDAEAPYPMNVMNLFIDMNEMLGPDFQKGMDKLKLIAEESAAAIVDEKSFDIQTIELETRTYIGVRKTISWSEMQSFFTSSFGAALEGVASAGFEMTGMPTGVYFTWDEENQQADLLAGVPVKEGDLEGMDSETIGGGSLLIEYYGPYAGTGDAHMAIEKYLKENGIQSTGMAIEEYVTDPTAEPDTLQWLTKIYYPLTD